jgi:hypothetical protein
MDSGTLNAGKLSVAGMENETVRSSVQLAVPLRGSQRSTLARSIAIGNSMTTRAGESPSS